MGRRITGHSFPTDKRHSADWVKQRNGERLDNADFLLEEDTPQMKLARMIDFNPEIQFLSDDFRLDMIDAGQKRWKKIRTARCPNKMGL